MPKSKRAKQVSLTKTKKQDTNEVKEKLVTKIEELIKKFDNIYVFEHQNMVTNLFRKYQEDLIDSKFVIGKNKVIQVALGKDEESELDKNTHKVSEFLIGDCGLLFTNKKLNEVQKYLDDNISQTYATAGNLCSHNIILEQGSNVFHKMSHSIEPYLRKLGLNTSLVNGTIQLLDNFILGQENQPLNPEQCKILKLLKIQVGIFRLNLIAHWKKPGTFKKL